MVFNFFVAFYNERGVLVTTPRAVREHYMHTRFVLDLVATAPFYPLVKLYGGAHGRHVAWLRLPHVRYILRTSYIRLTHVLHTPSRVKSMVRPLAKRPCAMHSSARGAEACNCLPAICIVQRNPFVHERARRQQLTVQSDASLQVLLCWRLVKWWRNFKV